MKKKTFITVVSIVHVIVLLFQCGIQMVYNNYRFGADFFKECSEAAVLCDRLARAIGYLEKEYNKADVVPGDVSIWEFETALSFAIYTFGYEDMPLLEEARTGYVGLLERIRSQISLTTGMKDPDNKRYMKLFADPERAEKMAQLRQQLEFMAVSFMEARDKYSVMSERDRYFTSWSKEREALTEKLKMPETLVAWSNELK